MLDAIKDCQSQSTCPCGESEQPRGRRWSLRNDPNCLHRSFGCHPTSTEIVDCPHRGSHPPHVHGGIRKLNTRRHTFAQALASPDYTLMEKQRLKSFSRDVFGQMKAIPW